MNRDDLVRLRRARDRMDREYAEPLDVTALARTALMSPGHFQRSFVGALQTMRFKRRAPTLAGLQHLGFVLDGWHVRRAHV